MQGPRQQHALALAGREGAEGPLGQVADAQLAQQLERARLVARREGVPPRRRAHRSARSPRPRVLARRGSKRSASAALVRPIRGRSVRTSTRPKLRAEHAEPGRSSGEVRRGDRRGGWTCRHRSGPTTTQRSPGDDQRGGFGEQPRRAAPDADAGELEDGSGAGPRRGGRRPGAGLGRANGFERHRVILPLPTSPVAAGRLRGPGPGVGVACGRPIRSPRSSCPRAARSPACAYPSNRRRSRGCAPVRTAARLLAARRPRDRRPGLRPDRHAGARWLGGVTAATATPAGSMRRAPPRRQARSRPP